MADDPQAQGDQPQDQQVTPEQVPAAPAAPVPAATPPAPGPWDTDLQQAFADEATRQQVDQFLRSKVQPYTTQLEQEAAKVRGLADAERLYNDLVENSDQTFVALAQELYGPEAAQKIVTDIQQRQQQQAPQDNQQAPQQNLDPEVQETLNWAQQKRYQEYYDSEKARIAQANPDIDANLLDPFVSSAGGDFDQAVELYRTFAHQWAQAHPGEAVPEVLSAPPVLTGDGAAPTGAPPIEAKKQTLDEALDDFMAEQRANKAPPTVGSI